MLLRRFLFSSLLVVFFLYTFLLSPVTAPVHAHALTASSPITVTSRSYAVHFPDAVTINVNATDPVSNIVRASIVIDLSEGSPQELHGVPVNKVGHSVFLSWREDTSGTHFIPPGTRVNYFWQFWDNAGNTLTDTPQQFSTVDTRFNWQHLTQDLLQVNWYNRGQDFGHVLLSQAAASVQHISSVLGAGLIHPINLWVYETDEDFHGSLAPGSYEWVGGEAFPTLHEASIAVASTSDTTLVRDMPHELTHLIFHQLIEKGIMVPTWFDEGLAVYNQTYHEPEMSQRFQKALNTHTLLRLYDISSDFPANADKAYLAYAQSWKLIDYMYSTFGQLKMARLIKQMNDSQTDFSEDLQNVLGMDDLHLENQWRLHLNQPGVIAPGELTPTPLPTSQPQQVPSANSSDNSFWLLIGLGALLVLGSLVGLILLLVFNVRRNKTRRTQVSVTIPESWQQERRNAPYSYTDPSTYMQTSMYAEPSSQPPAFTRVQEYPAMHPRKQAPQE